MLLSIALIVIISIALQSIFNKLNIPGLIAFMITGILLGPFVFDLISDSILDISSDLRKIALVVILIRAGLSLNTEDLKAVGRPALLLSFIPATLEILLIAFLAPLLFNISTIEAFILGAVVAAVSPAIIVPRMIGLIEKKIGNQKKIPQLILGAASIDDIFVIIVFTILLQVYETSQLQIGQILLLPLSLLLGIISGILTGIFLTYIFKKLHFRDTVKVLIIFALAFFLIVLEDYIPISGLLAVITFSITLLKYYPLLADRLKIKFSKIWVVAELTLFVLIGAAVDIAIFKTIGFLSLLLISVGLIFRLLGVGLSIIGTPYNLKEKIFIGFSYTPKATVQAAIGAIPLSLGMPGSQLILAISVFSIFLTAPIGAYLIDYSAEKLLR